MENFFIVIACIAGWIAGALVNYLADVLPTQRRLARPFCLHCQAGQKIIPYLFWPRRCEACGYRRPARTWLVEILMIGLSVALWVINAGQDWFAFPANLLVVALFMLIAVIDIEQRLILHPVSLAGALLGLGLGAWRHGWISTILGGVTGFGTMLVFYFLGIAFVRLIARLRGKPIEEEEGLGFGDVNLGGVIGLFLGWPGIVAGLVLSILLGGAVSILYLLFTLLRRRYRPGLALPYGPFLAASTVILLYFKDILIGG